MGPQYDPLNVEGEFIAKLETEDCCSNRDIYVVKNVSQPLLSWPAIRALNIFTNVNIIFYNEESVKAYTIKLKPDAKLFCLRMQR